MFPTPELKTGEDDMWNTVPLRAPSLRGTSMSQTLTSNE